ncbi:hypothetical protein AOQ84DRAFT_377465 [Glonium stellatum]|uniref:Mid2 domain-containing protein n=1 Tax=Glonium stellatum TaxID=574774 RepID=A0A8E2JSE5_9PEZI|nr:hypothetical protein AOQ84DRAFT_377465 [Glonium stellatum]
MATTNAVLFSIFALLVPCLTQMITARAKLPHDEPLTSPDVLSLELEDFSLSNITLVNQPSNAAFPSIRLTNQNRIPRGAGNPLRRRDNCCFPSASDAYCTATGSAASTFYTSVDDTQTTTEILSSTDVVTESNVATATAVDIVTVGGRTANKARRWFSSNTANPPSGPSSVASLTSTAASLSTTKNIPKERQQYAISPHTTSNPLFARSIFPKLSNFFLAKRQIILIHIASTQMIYNTIVVNITSTISYTDIQTTTTTEYITTTLALDAKTTIHITSTTTLNSASAATSTNTQAGGGGGSASLSTGAQAGIGVGTAAGSLIICTVLIIFIRRRRKREKEKVAQMTGSAVVAAIAATSGRPPNGVSLYYHNS